MNREKQRIAIAEACGTKLVEALDGFWDVERNGKMHAVGRCKKDLVQGLPDYLADLNAMHEAEKVLTQQQRIEYVRELVFIWTGRNDGAIPNWWFVHAATASERAEALLRTVGKWEDDE